MSQAHPNLARRKLANRSPTNASITVSALFSLLNDNTIRYCVSHGYQNLPESWGSDIDIVVDRTIDAPAIGALIRENETLLKANIVRQAGFYITLQCVKDKGPPEFVNIDFSHDAYLEGILLASGEFLLGEKQKRLNFWIPSAVNSIVIQALRVSFRDAHNETDLEGLAFCFFEDATRMKIGLQSVWPDEIVTRFSSIMQQRSWNAFPGLAKSLRQYHRRQQMKTHPLARPHHCCKTIIGRLRRLASPPGIHVVFLGPDGAGKSTTIDGTAKALQPLFSRSEIVGFAPPVSHLFRRSNSKRDTSKPHSMPPRSWLISLLRAGYWATHALFAHASIRLTKARSVLVLSDRYFFDILVDPVRYRYGGPRWALRLVKWLTPKPDLTILLNGRPAVLQARKREISIEATAALCAGYLNIVKNLPCSRTINAEQTPEAVVREVVANVVSIIRQ